MEKKSSKNKQAFIVFVTNEWKKDKYMEKLSGKTLVVTCGNSCYQLSSGVVQPISELESTQEEADTRMLLHSLHAARSRFASVVIVSEDTDQQRSACADQYLLLKFLCF